jgi:tetratricopeptide (TPR) repeat protein
VRKEAPKHEVMPKVLFRLGLARCEREDWKGALEALGALASAKRDFENQAEADLARGRALAHLDRSRDAQAAFERTIALDKGVLGARAHLELGRLHLASKANESALSEFLKVEVLYDLPEETAEAMLGAGGALEAMGDAKRAAEQYRELVEKHGQSPAAAAAKRRLAELEPKGKRQA